MKEKIKQNMVLRSLLFVALGILLLPGVNGQEPPVENESKDCLVYSFTSSESYNFLISNNSKHFGTTLQIIHNCEFVQIDIEGQFYARSNNSFAIDITPGFHNLTFSNESVFIKCIISTLMYSIMGASESFFTAVWKYNAPRKKCCVESVTKN